MFCRSVVQAVLVQSFLTLVLKLLDHDTPTTQHYSLAKGSGIQKFASAIRNLTVITGSLWELLLFVFGLCSCAARLYRPTLPVFCVCRLFLLLLFQLLFCMLFSLLRHFHFLSNFRCLQPLILQLCWCEGVLPVAILSMINSVPDCLSSFNLSSLLPILWASSRAYHNPSIRRLSSAQTFPIPFSSCVFFLPCGWQTFFSSFIFLLFMHLLWSLMSQVPPFFLRKCYRPNHRLRWLVWPLPPLRKVLTLLWWLIVTVTLCTLVTAVVIVLLLRHWVAVAGTVLLPYSLSLSLP